MKRVFLINKKRFLGSYALLQQNGSGHENAMFLPGVVFTMVVPVISYCSYGGPVRPLVFAGVMLVGTVLGMVKYRGRPGSELTSLDIGTAPRTRSRVDLRLKKAA